MTNQVVTSFQVQSVILTKSTFKRKEFIDFSKVQKPSVDINSSSVKANNPDGLFCLVELTYKAFIEGEAEPIVESLIKMGATFTIHGESPVDMDTFGKVNAPAIIYPFIREHLSSLSVKAGLNPILLPPVNFQAISQQNEKKG